MDKKDVTMNIDKPTSSERDGKPGNTRDLFVPLERLVSRACPSCGHIHTSDDARCVNRFSEKPKRFIAQHGHTLRHTRQEAEKDECAWRVENKAKQLSAIQHQPRKKQVEIALKSVVKKIPPEFPAAKMEIAAREKAWLDFLAHINTSLIVWEIDKSLHGDIDSPVEWLQRCRDELAAMLQNISG